jgi:hypothetical protein
MATKNNKLSNPLRDPVSGIIKNVSVMATSQNG